MVWTLTYQPFVISSAFVQALPVSIRWRSGDSPSSTSAAGPAVSTPSDISSGISNSTKLGIGLGVSFGFIAFLLLTAGAILVAHCRRTLRTQSDHPPNVSELPLENEVYELEGEHITPELGVMGVGERESQPYELPDCW